jgi:dTDP-4-amino-4,6-dideoxygalactose transaminase
MILTNSDEIAEKSRSLRIHGMARERYYYDDIGYTSRMAEIQAAVLACKLKRLDDWNLRRVEVAKIYQNILDGENIRVPHVCEGNNHTWHQFTVQHPRRDELMEFLKSHEIDSGIYYPVPLHLHVPYQEFGNGVGSLPVTEEVSRQCVSLPTHQHLSDDQVTFAAQKVAEFCRSNS